MGRQIEPPPYTKRELTASEEEIIEELFRRKYYMHECIANGVPYESKNDLPTHAYCTTTEPVTMRVWHGHGSKPEFTEHTVPAGTTLKIVMISRLGDFGLTDELSTVHGYDVRLQFDSASIKDLRWEP